MRDARQKYQAAMKVNSSHPDQRKMSAVLGMGFLLGAEMYGAAEAMSALYANEYGWDALPETVKELESE